MPHPNVSISQVIIKLLITTCALLSLQHTTSYPNNCYMVTNIKEQPIILKRLENMLHTDMVQLSNVYKV